VNELDDDFMYIPLRDGGARAIHRESGVDAVARDAPVYTMNKDTARREVLRQIEDAGLAT
jgi:hypothetical protein